MVLFQIGIPLIIIVIAGLIFNPYLSHKPKNILERWSTRERSFGHPYYWRMRYCAGKQSDSDNPLHLGWLNNERYEWCKDYSKDCKDNYLNRHQDVYNRFPNRRGFIKNVMYIES